jgi:hypothetical protein
MHNLARLRRVEKAQAWDKGYKTPYRAWSATRRLRTPLGPLSA